MEENNKKTGKFSPFWVVALLVVVLLVALLFVDFGNTGEQINLNDVVSVINGEDIDGDGVADQAYFIYCKNGTGYIITTNSDYDVSQLPKYADYHFDYDTTGADGFLDYMVTLCIDKGIYYQYAEAGISFWDVLVPILYIAFAGLIIYLFYRMLVGANKGTMSFGKTKVKTYQMSKVKFSDIAGMDEEKAELQEVVEFLKNPKKFTDLGARIPKGVLLVGQPGTGKTLLARAVAGESRVPFISISGSDFVEMFVGVGASRVRDLFDQAKKNKPCIVFIDEIDAVGRQRGAGLGGGNDEREQTLNQLLVEMDGFETNEGIIVLAATNRSDILDPALMRPGRFDRQIYVHVPDVKGREGILRIHARNKPIDENVDFSVLARITTGFTGADIENMLNEAAILAARAGRGTILMEDITEGINKVIMGPQKKSRVITEKEKKLTAYHEAGHTILAKLLPHCDDVQEVSIIQRENAGGYTMSRPETDDMTMSYGKAMDTIAMSMGGRLAEELIFEDITSGASSDIQHATKIAHAMVYDWGMSKKVGFFALGDGSQVFIGRDYQTKNDFSEKLAGLADDEMMDILNTNYERGKKLLTENIGLLHELAKLLLARETIYKEEVDMILAGKKTEEIVEIVEAREKVQREKEKKEKEIRARREKLENFRRKIAEGENLVKMGVITQDELDALKNECQSYELSLEREKLAKESAEKTGETAENSEENAEKADVQDEKNEENQGETKAEKETKVKTRRGKNSETERAAKAEKSTQTGEDVVDEQSQDGEKNEANGEKSDSENGEISGDSQSKKNDNIDGEN